MSFARGFTNAVPLALVGWILFAAVCVVSCRLTRRTPTPPPFVPPSSSSLPAPPAAAAVTLDAAAPVPRNRYGRHGRFRVVHKSACDSRGGNPLVWPYRRPRDPAKPRPPAAGEPMLVQWTTEGAIEPFPNVATVLLVSFNDVRPIELHGVGLDGCSFHVDGNPKNLYAFTPGTVPWLTQAGGKVWLEWTPPASFAGVELNMQLVVHAPGENDSGWLLSPGLELWIGRGDT